jgi:dephospho-CoA kinase
MKIIGLTGAIGSGKSYIAQIFESIGIPIYNSDKKAKLIIQQNTELQNAIIQLLGKNAFLENGVYNTSFVAKIVFNDNEKLNKLNHLVHNYVKEDSEKWALENNNAPYLLKESALLFEANVFINCFKTICVIAPEILRIERVMNRDKISENEVQNRMKNQYSQEKKAELADYIIINDGKALIIPQVYNIHQNILHQINVDSISHKNQ